MKKATVIVLFVLGACIISGCGASQEEKIQTVTKTIVMKDVMGILNADCVAKVLRENLSEPEINLLYEGAKADLDKNYKPKIKESDVSQDMASNIGNVVGMKIPFQCNKMMNKK